MARISKTWFKNFVNDVVKKIETNFKIKKQIKKQIKEDALKWYEEVEKYPGYLKSIHQPESYITSVIYEIVEKYF